VGWGVPKDDASAAFWLRKAADQGDAIAECKLGILYLTGRGVAQDDSVAAIWFTKSAEQGDRDAQANLASLYQVGRGVPRDLSQAYLWRLLSFDGTEAKQNPRLVELSGQMNNDEIAAAEHRASEWRLARQSASPPPLEISDIATSQ
jgi:hypothetical protein